MKGAKESETFNKQLILTGSYAGKTTGQLNAMAKSLAGNGVTQHDAAGVLAQVVGSGSVYRAGNGNGIPYRDQNAGKRGTISG
ncbi:tail protein [Salmonella enterica subsp. enterica]|uniref:Tail protein n=1 Tax=Salmonella enterica I TaxID=59201 RepID=A0A447N622_SALET|nr:tail protein [Salmonella enterica subsp. enterica]